LGYLGPREPPIHRVPGLFRSDRRLAEWEEHRKLQLHLLEQPERGDIIKGAGGLRKLRWAGSGRGKRGGIRVIYYLWRGDIAFLLFAYPKNQQEDLTSAQAKLLRSLIESYTYE